MRSTKFAVLLVALVLALAFQSISTAFALDPYYVQINNGTIVTNWGQQPQVVAQFGNTTQTTLYRTIIACYFPQELGTVTAVYAGPFHTDNLSNYSGYNQVVGGGVATGIFNGFIIEVVNLIPGQNYNFSFNIQVADNAPSSSSVTCGLFGSTDPNGGGSGTVSVATVPVQVQ